jgi:uncharacterized protein (TIGR03435 family)
MWASTATLLLALAAGYSQTAPEPHFEVASVKAAGDEFSTRPQRAGGRIRWTTQLCYLVAYAYSLDFSRVSGPKCGATYSVEATFDPAATDDQVRLMIQSLLADRFKLRAHRVTTLADGYALVIGKGGPKIKEPPAPEPETYISATIPQAGVAAITARGVSMAKLAETLSRTLQTPVWDRTALAGNFYFAFRFSEMPRADVETDAPSLATALQESLGLKLEKQKGPVETLVIDSVEEPTVN